MMLDAFQGLQPNDCSTDSSETVRAPPSAPKITVIHHSVTGMRAQIRAYPLLCESCFLLERLLGNEILITPRTLDRMQHNTESFRRTTCGETET